MNKDNSSKFHSFNITLKVILSLIIYIFISAIFVILCNDEINVIATFSNGCNSYPVVIIDAGHGGIDGGAISQNGIVEKDINLSISKNIKSLFDLSGIECIMTREDDYELEPQNSYSSSRKRRDLLARIEITENYENAVLVSIHQNTYPSSKLKGLQVFYSKNDIKSKDLASIIKNNNFILLDKDNLREIKAAGREILVLDSVECPAVLIECGFLSNAHEASLLSDELYQKKLAFMIFKSINDFLQINFS